MGVQADNLHLESSSDVCETRGENGQLSGHHHGRHETSSEDAIEVDTYLNCPPALMPESEPAAAVDEPSVKASELRKTADDFDAGSDEGDSFGIRPIPATFAPLFGRTALKTLGMAPSKPRMPPESVCRGLVAPTCGHGDTTNSSYKSFGPDELLAHMSEEPFASGIPVSASKEAMILARMPHSALTPPGTPRSTSSPKKKEVRFDAPVPSENTTAQGEHGGIQWHLLPEPSRPFEKDTRGKVTRKAALSYRTRPAGCYDRRSGTQQNSI